MKKKQKDMNLNISDVIHQANYTNVVNCVCEVSGGKTMSWIKKNSTSLQLGSSLCKLMISDIKYSKAIMKQNYRNGNEMKQEAISFRLLIEKKTWDERLVRL